MASTYTGLCVYASFSITVACLHLPILTVRGPVDLAACDVLSLATGKKRGVSRLYVGVITLNKLTKAIRRSIA